MFKVMADFDETVPRTPANEMEYARFIATRSHEEGLLHLDREAVGRIIEYGSRLAGTQNKLSTRFGNIADLVREANYWAKAKERETVSVDDVEEAIDHNEYLHNRIETRMREHLMDGKQLVATSGSVTGQINGLTVSQVGDHAFGHVSRVTARTYVGKEGVVQIDREVELAGQIHNKGLMTLVGYLGGRYAGDLPLALSAQLTFEQSYGGIEGDFLSYKDGAAHVRGTPAIAHSADQGRLEARRITWHEDGRFRAEGRVVADIALAPKGPQAERTPWRVRCAHAGVTRSVSASCCHPALAGRR